MTTPHQSGALFVGEWVFQNRGVCGQAFFSFPSPTPLLTPFAFAPIFARPECEQLLRAARSLRSKRSRTTRTKFGPREGAVRIRAARKLGRKQKGVRRGYHLFAFAPIFARPECEKDLHAARFRSPRTGTLVTQATKRGFGVTL